MTRERLEMCDCDMYVDNQINDFVSSSLQTFLCVLDYREPNQTFVIDRGNFVEKCPQLKLTHFSPSNGIV